MSQGQSLAASKGLADAAPLRTPLRENRLYRRQ
jgi:hypothetical protein